MSGSPNPKDAQANRLIVTSIVEADREHEFVNRRVADNRAPIAVFAFNRPRHLARALDALSANRGARQSPVIVFCDGARSPKDHDRCNEVISVASSATGFASLRVVKRERNLGCAASVIAGVDEVLHEYDRLIVIEDDIVTSPDTLTFLNEALSFYSNDAAVFSIAAWAPPYTVVPRNYPYNSYFFPRFHCWGWATWRDRWALNDWAVPGYGEYVNHAFLPATHRRSGDDLPTTLRAQMEGRIDSWAVRAEYTRFMKGSVTLYPCRTFVLNIGMDGTGRHCAATDRYGVQVPDDRVADSRPFPTHVCVVDEISAVFPRIYRRASVIRRIWARLVLLFQGTKKRCIGV